MYYPYLTWSTMGRPSMKVRRSHRIRWPKLSYSHKEYKTICSGSIYYCRSCATMTDVTRAYNTPKRRRKEGQQLYASSAPAAIEAGFKPEGARCRVTPCASRLPLSAAAVPSYSLAISRRHLSLLTTTELHSAASQRARYQLAQLNPRLHFHPPTSPGKFQPGMYSCESYSVVASCIL